MNQKAFQKYLATGEYVPTEDAAPTSLEAHDRRFHPNGFDPKKDHCGLRESMGKLDKVDFSLTDAPNNHPYSGFPVNQNPDFTRPQETRKNSYENLEERHKAHNDPDYLPPNLRNPYVRKDGKIGMTSEQVNKAQEWERQHKDEIEAYRKAQKTFFEDRKRENGEMIKEIESTKKSGGKSAIDKYLEAVEKKRTDDKPSETKKSNLNTPMGLYQHFRDQERSLREKGATQMADEAKSNRDDMAFLARMQADIEKKMGGGDNASLDKAIEGLALNLFDAIKKARDEVKKVPTADLKAVLKEGEENNSANLDTETRNLVFSLNNNSPSLSTGGNRANVEKSLDSVKQRLASDLLQNWVITCELKRRGESI